MTQHKTLTAVGVWKPALAKLTKELNILQGNGWTLHGPIRTEYFGMFGRKYLVIANLTKPLAHPSEVTK